MPDQKLLNKNLTAQQKAAIHKALDTAAIAINAVHPLLPSDDTVTSEKLNDALRAIDEGKELYGS